MSSHVGIVWFRRDLRLADNACLARAAAECDELIPLFVVDDRLWPGRSANRRWFLSGCLTALDAGLADLGGVGGGEGLVVRHGDPALAIAELAGEHGVTRLYRADDCTPGAARRDAEVDDALGGAVETIVADSPYVSAPGELRTGSGDPFKVFTPYWRRWAELAVAAEVDTPDSLTLVGDVDHDGVPDGGEPSATDWRPEPGEAAGAAALERFLADGVAEYDDDRDRPAADATSRLGPYLKFGCVHPRQIVRRLDRRRRGHDTFAKELAWRDFYAAVLDAWPESAWSAWAEALAGIETDRGAATTERFEAWRDGRTGFPIVDAGMRQLRAEGFMHNRVRMIVASFLVKDLHLEWQRGAAWFLEHLYDGDLPSNNHGWQWAAGTGTDAAPYFRVFNPTLQGERFDPAGDYVRRWIPELADAEAATIHRPATEPTLAGYPAAIVDHAAERDEALRRYAATRD